jgi:hypothetical protein
MPIRGRQPFDGELFTTLRVSAAGLRCVTSNPPYPQIGHAVTPECAQRQPMVGGALSRGSCVSREGTAVAPGAVEPPTPPRPGLDRHPTARTRVESCGKASSLSGASDRTPPRVMSHHDRVYTVIERKVTLRASQHGYSFVLSGSFEYSSSPLEWRNS